MRHASSRLIYLVTTVPWQICLIMTICMVETSLREVLRKLPLRLGVSFRDPSKYRKFIWAATINLMAVKYRHRKLAEELLLQGVRCMSSSPAISPLIWIREGTSFFLRSLIQTSKHTKRFSLIGLSSKNKNGVRLLNLYVLPRSPITKSLA